MMMKILAVTAFSLAGAGCATQSQQCEDITGPGVPPAEATHHARVVGRVLSSTGAAMAGLHVKSSFAASAPICRQLDVLHGFGTTSTDGTYTLDLETVAPRGKDGEGDIWVVAVRVDDTGTVALDSVYVTVQPVVKGAAPIEVGAPDIVVD